MRKFNQIPLQILTFQSLHMSVVCFSSTLLKRTVRSTQLPSWSTLSTSPTSLTMSTAASSSSGTTPPHRHNIRQRRHRIAVIGGGASGMFAATAAADAVQKYMHQQHISQQQDSLFSGCDVIVYEGTSKTMSKVRISGGGRCNVMHDRTKPLPQILSSYPRGNKELRGIYTKRFTPLDAYDWFTSRGVQLKTESDGRMFPITDNSQTIIDAIAKSALKVGVDVRIKEKVDSVEWLEENDDDKKGKFIVNVSSKSSDQKSTNQEQFDAIILATGSFPLGHEIARSLGHEIIRPVPSLFTFDAKALVREGGSFNGLAGVSVPLARLTLTVEDEMANSSNSASGSSKTAQTDSGNDGANAIKPKRKRKKKATTIMQEGPLLITHHGISGPATLRLSAFAAREFHAVGYKCDVKIHFCPQWEDEQRALSMSETGPNRGDGGSSEGILVDFLWEMTRRSPKRQISSGSPLLMKGMGEEEDESSNSNNMPIIPKRLWSALVHHSGITPTTSWGDASKSMIRSLANNISSFSLTVTSKSVFKDEFVTAGGVHLKEVQMTNMESRVTPGLFMCGEVLDVDGVTGGFNFMGCWSTGFLAGEGAAAFCLKDNEGGCD